jgi:protein O-GlcNAc transferase
MNANSKKKKVKGAAPAQHQLNSLLAFYQNGQFAFAEMLAVSLTQEFPKDQFAWKLLGPTLKQLGRLDDSLVAFKRSAGLAFQDAGAHYNLGVTLQELGRFDEAELSYKKATELNPALVEAHGNLGITLHELGRLDAAVVSYSKAIALSPDYALAHSNLGLTLHELGKLDEAKASFKQAIALNPDLAVAHYNMGNTLKKLGTLVQAEASYKQAIALNPNFCEAHYNVGVMLQELGRLNEAQASYKQAIALNPDYALAHNNLGVTLQELGKFDEAEVSYTKAIALKPYDSEAHSNRLMLAGSMLFDPGNYQKYAAYFSNITSKRVGKHFTSWPDIKESKRLRIGFVSGDFRSHPVGYFIESLLVKLQQSSIDLFAYPTLNKEDPITGRLKPLFHHWHSLVGLSDEQAAQRINNDKIHILFDLSGHTAHNRLPVFAWKPAPLQVSWLGYFASTGLPEIDYILGDPFVTPVQEAEHFIEKIWQLPESYLCFTPPDLDLKVCPLPAFSKEFITFGCFNKLSRMTDEVVSVRAEILHSVPESRLFLKDQQLEHDANRDRVVSRFASCGVTADRLILEGRDKREDYLACYNRVDLALSPFPYGGGTTSLEGLWMGVPVLTKTGNHFLSHVGESIAHNSGLSDWVAADNNDYIDKAIAFASDLEKLAALRRGLREQVLGSPFFNAEKFAFHFEQTIREMVKLHKITSHL